MIYPFFFRTSAASPIRSTWIAIGFLLQAGCGSAPEFVHEPPASYRVSAAAEMQGVWMREGKDNGERARVGFLGDGTMHIDFFKTASLSKSDLAESVIVQTLRFDEMDWLLIDMRKFNIKDSERYARHAPYRLVRYAFEDPDRLCGIEPSAQPFADAIASGELDGRVETYVSPLKRVTVTSAGTDWLKWWSALPAAAKMFSGPVVCLRRVG